MNFKQLPLYRIVVDLEDEDEMMTAISLVDEPAIERDFLAFEKQEPMKFSVADATEHKITGPAIICDLPIYRIDPIRGEYMVVFDREAIDNIILKYSKCGLNNLVDLQHDGEMIEGITMIEMYQKNSELGISPKGYEDLSDYSLFVTYKIEDEELWNRIIAEDTDLKGFSIEITAGLELTEQTVDDGEEEFDDIWEWLSHELGFVSEKKKSDIINDAIDDESELTVKMTGGRTIKGYGYTTWKNDGSENVALWDGKNWHTINVSNIESVSAQSTTIKPNWTEAVGHPDFTLLVKDINNPNVSDVKRVATAPKSDIERAILEHKIVMIRYDDPTDEPCKGFRQCLVAEYGYTIANNACLRVYEYMGATHTGDNLPGWRNMLLSRIQSFKINELMEPIMIAPEGFNPNADRDGFVALLKAEW